MDPKFGLIGRLTKKQTDRRHFSDMPVGTEFMILQTIENNGYYDALVYFINYPPQILENGEKHYTGYVEKDSYEIIGTIKYEFKK